LKLATKFVGEFGYITPSRRLNYDAPRFVSRTVRSVAKGEAIRDRYIGLGDKFDIAVIEDLVTGNLTEALQGTPSHFGD